MFLRVPHDDEPNNNNRNSHLNRQHEEDVMPTGDSSNVESAVVVATESSTDIVAPGVGGSDGNDVGSSSSIEEVMPPPLTNPITAIVSGQLFEEYATRIAGPVIDNAIPVITSSTSSEQQQQQQRTLRRNILLVLLNVTIVVVLVIVLSVVRRRTTATSSPIAAAATTTMSPTMTTSPSTSPTPLPTLNDEQLGLLEYIMSISFDNGTALTNHTSPQYHAFDWLANTLDQGITSDLKRFELIERYVYAIIYFTTGGPTGAWVRNDGWLNPNEHICDWSPQSISTLCTNNGREEIMFQGRNLVGYLPIEIGLLTSLTSIEIPDNSITTTPASTPASKPPANEPSQTSSSSIPLFPIEYKQEGHLPAASIKGGHYGLELNSCCHVPAVNSDDQKTNWYHGGK